MLSLTGIGLLSSIPLLAMTDDDEVYEPRGY